MIIRKKKNPLSVIFAMMAMFTFVLFGAQNVSARELNKNNLADGTYAINVALWHATNNNASMAGGVLLPGAEIVVEDEVLTLTLNINKDATIMGMPAVLNSMRIYTDSSRENLVQEVTGNPSVVSFEMPHTEEFIYVTVVANGMMTQQARIKLDWNSLEVIELAGDNGSEAEDNGSEAEDNSSEAEDNGSEAEDNGSEAEDNGSEAEDNGSEAEGNGSETEDSDLNINDLVDGMYEINVALWHATNDAPSMAANTLQDIAEINVANGVYTMTVFPQAGVIMGRPAHFESLEVFDTNGNAVPVLIGELNEDGKPTSFSFEMPHTEEFISVAANGSGARLRLDWDSLVQVSTDIPGDNNNNDNNNNDNNNNDNNNNDNNNNNNDNNNDNNNSGSGDTNLDINNLVDGTYEINIALWHATNNQASMANGVFQDIAEIVVADGVYTMVIHTQPTEIMGQAAILEAMRVYGLNGESITMRITESDSNGNPTSLAFEMPHTEEFIAVSITAMDGMMVQDARLKLDWNSLTLVSSEAPDVPTGTTPDSGNNGNDTNDNNGNVGNGDTTLDINNLEDGIYEVQVALWHATNNTPSMANAALKNIARIVVEDGVYTMFTYTQPMTMGTITASLQAMRVEAVNGGLTNATVRTTDNAGNPTSFSFTMPHTEQFIDVKVNPMVALMGNQYIDARLNVNWGSIQQVSSTTDLESAPSGATGGETSSSVDTSDNANTAFYTMALLTSGLAIGFYIWKNTSRKAVRVNGQV